MQSASISQPPSSFKYVFVPVAGSVEERSHPQVDLGSDKFVESVKRNFSATPLPYEACVEQLQSQNLAMTPELLSHIQQGGALQYAEITTVLLPTEASNFRCISVYSDANARVKNLSVNTRASAFLRACGISDAEIFGDIFVSRLFDCETVEVAGGWWREDFLLETDFVSKEGNWREIAKAMNSKRRGNGPSLSSSLATMLKQQPQAAAPSGAPAPAAHATGAASETVQFQESQDSVEVTVPLPLGATKSDIKVGFKPTWLGISIQNKPVLMGTLFGRIQVDACVWTLEKDKVVVTLEKETEKLWGDLWVQ